MRYRINKEAEGNEEREERKQGRQENKNKEKCESAKSCRKCEEVKDGSSCDSDPAQSSALQSPERVPVTAPFICSLTSLSLQHTGHLNTRLIDSPVKRNEGLDVNRGFICPEGGRPDCHRTVYLSIPTHV